jgi:hypothetical protein
MPLPPNFWDEEQDTPWWLLNPFATPLYEADDFPPIADVIAMSAGEQRVSWAIRDGMLFTVKASKPGVAGGRRVAGLFALAYAWADDPSDFEKCQVGWLHLRLNLWKVLREVYDSQVVHPGQNDCVIRRASLDEKHWNARWCPSCNLSIVEEDRPEEHVGLLLRRHITEGAWRVRKKDLVNAPA